MIKVKDIWDSVLFKIQTEENGDLDEMGFNNISAEAELRVLDWLTGDVEGIKPPVPMSNQKLRDYLIPVMAAKDGQVEGGYFEYPEDYYQYDNFYRLGSAVVAADCESSEVTSQEGCNTPIEILQSQAFNYRCKTSIRGLQPSINKPIAKQVGLPTRPNDKNPKFAAFQIVPKDLGSARLEYIRYPKFAKIVTKVDPIYMNRDIDLKESQDYEWGEGLRPALIWFIIDGYKTHNREKALAEMNNATAKTPRG